ncbi:hypothetical protein S40293_10385 [Stachybotrys chartarum IBT 40293]|nr:hypothetical protein S40293_10385 [Stachybotrys chartarum IBT 40293]
MVFEVSTSFGLFGVGVHFEEKTTPAAAGSCYHIDCQAVSTTVHSAWQTAGRSAARTETLQAPLQLQEPDPPPHLLRSLPVSKSLAGGCHWAKAARQTADSHVSDTCLCATSARLGRPLGVVVPAAGELAVGGDPTWHRPNPPNSRWITLAGSPAVSADQAPSRYRPGPVKSRPSFAALLALGRRGFAAWPAV